MWLLDSKSLELKLYYDNNIPPYAILSHAWEENEVSFQQINGPRDQIQFHAGFIKIQRCCAQAATYGFEHVWIDTCCIDKTNSVELSEAINSMFNWYRNATECYVYLADVTSLKDFGASRWFTRGWTLQELIAPDSAIFFNKDWIEMGTKTSLVREIAIITKIPIEVLLHQDGPKFSVAQIMSWAANRQTTRVEDQGYCLLGLFGVNMPMIYGEGQKAFLRLQHEIIKASTDQSLFAWTVDGKTYPGPQNQGGAFARSPAYFARCARVVQSTDGGHSEFTLTNKGLRIEVILAAAKSKENLWIAYLDCAELENSRYRLGILLKKVDDDVYYRTSLRGILTQPKTRSESIADRATIYITDASALSLISRWMPNPAEPLRKGTVTFFIPRSQGKEHGYSNTMTEYYPSGFLEISEHRLGPDLGKTYTVNKNNYSRSVSPWLRWGCALNFQHKSNLASQFIVIFGVIEGSRVWSNLELASDSHPNLDDILRSYFYDDDLVPSNRRSQGLMGDNLRDRVILPLEDGSVVNLAIKKMIISGKVIHVVNITIT
jgi:hypothetical protein